MGRSTSLIAHRITVLSTVDPSLSESGLSAIGLDRTGMIIARALQKYGMILIDVSGRPKLYAENFPCRPARPTAGPTRLHS